MNIITNHKARPMLAFIDLPVKAQSDFDYLDDSQKCEYRIVQYKGAFYDVYDTQRIELDTITFCSPMGWAMRVKPDNPMAKYDCLISESYFSGVLFKLADDYCVICARYYS